MKKLRVAIVFGGANSEHEVSCMSAASVVENADRNKYELVLLGITRDGRWLRYTGGVADMRACQWAESDAVSPAFIAPDTGIKGIVTLEEGRYTLLAVDVVFPVLHGRMGEDGTIQGLFEMAGLPYVGCGVMASANCMDKAVTKTLLTAAGIPNAAWRLVTPEDMPGFDAMEKEMAESLKYPMFVKPAGAGSSVGVGKGKDKASLRAAIETAFKEDRKVLVEEAITGQEVESAVMGNRAPVAAPVVGEIAPKHEFYDYAGKYLDDSTSLYIPARIPEEAAERVRAMAVKAYKALDCAGLSRVDFFFQADGSIILNEINTLPGFTHISMYPKMFMAGGMSYSDIIDSLINLALE